MQAPANRDRPAILLLKILRDFSQGRSSVRGGISRYIKDIEFHQRFIASRAEDEVRSIGRYPLQLSRNFLGCSPL